MAAGSEDSQREIGQLRGDMSSAVAELRSRLGAGAGRALLGEARVSAERSAARVQENPSVLVASGLAAAGLAGAVIFAVVRHQREQRRLQNRVRTRAQDLRSELQEWVNQSRERADRARHRDLLVRLQPVSGGYSRVVEARLAPAGSRPGKRNDVLKKLIWGLMLSVFTAVASVVARRAAGQVWQSTVRESPPSEQKQKSE